MLLPFHPAHVGDDKMFFIGRTLLTLLQVSFTLTSTLCTDEYRHATLSKTNSYLLSQIA